MKSILTISIIAVSLLCYGQTAEQREVIKSSMDQSLTNKAKNEVVAYTTEKEKRIETFLKNNPDKKKTFIKEGRVYSLYDVNANGSPIYITTKDIPQVNNTKASALYSGGSIGVNITGTGMVAGVWDGGQVNASHISLLGRVAMQTGQPLSSAGGNAHQTAVTGIILAKNFNNAQGIAYGATTQNYDWDDDLTEMNAFADNGFLISNHSYGYSNDSSMDTWQFGAYDDQSKAWDALLKAKSFYLPFVAGGNEQQSNGNSAAGGFDIITGSSASKNVVTVGSVNSDNTMTDYSNWGPTDDGRIKPDIVTLGSSVDVPLYDDNTGYTGNVSSSSGTSYASPAAAAGALLLQQYYYSLNNSYMKASMLKALLLHSADDDASNNGPDAKFGWGILNLEKAANIIKQNSTVGGTAKMLMISTNPANDATDELLNNFTFGSDGVRASLAWVDDDGAEQTSADGANNTTNRMVYNFSMKLEQVSPALSAFPYKNLSVSSPGTPAVAGDDWFQSANNYIQANLSATTDNANGKVTIRKSASSPSATREIALIITGIKAPPLPIELSSFTAKIINQDGHLAWTTATEVNTDYFVIERSLNARDFVEIGRLDAAGNSSTPLNYKYVDADLPINIVYYRLRTVDVDDKTTHSRIVSVLNQKENIFHITPNPTTNHSTITLSKSLDTDAVIDIYDMLGVELMTETFPANQVSTNLNVSALPTGNYVLRIKGQNIALSKLFTKR